MIDYATVRLDYAKFAALQSALGNVSLTTAVKLVMVHEIEHLLDLNDENTAPTPACNADPTVMNANQAISCGLYTPQRCDISTFNSAYTGWATHQWC